MSKEFDDISDFTHTEYFKQWNDLLNSEELVSILDAHNLTMIFYPHRNMQKFLSYFSSGSNRIIIADWRDYDVQQLLKESAFLITDYSSVAMDFGYMCKPMLYYQFDEEIFQRGQYSEGYFSYRQDGFGPVCDNLEQLINRFETEAKNNLQSHPEYLRREQDFFTLRDKNNCKRNYEAIKNF